MSILHWFLTFFQLVLFMLRIQIILWGVAAEWSHCPLLLNNKSRLIIVKIGCLHSVKLLGLLSSFFCKEIPPIPSHVCPLWSFLLFQLHNITDLFSGGDPHKSGRCASVQQCGFTGVVMQTSMVSADQYGIFICLIIIWIYLKIKLFWGSICEHKSVFFNNN